MEVYNPKIILHYNDFFIERYESVMLNLRYAQQSIEQHSKGLSEAVAEYSQQFSILSDLYSDCGFEEFNDLLQSLSSLNTSYSQGIIEQSDSMTKHLEALFRFHHKESASFKELSVIKKNMRLSSVRCCQS